MLAYFGALLSGDQDALRSALLFGAVLGGILVGAGIIWEAKKLDAATVTVFVGIVLEAICTIALFVTDENISRTQQAKIQQLETPRTLSDEQKARIANALKSLPPVTFVTVTVPEAEPWGFVMDIAAALKANGWNWEPCVSANGQALSPRTPDARPSSCTSILNTIEIDAPPALEGVANALKGALIEPGVIGMDRVVVLKVPGITAMEIMVGSKR